MFKGIIAILTRWRTTIVLKCYLCLVIWVPPVCGEGTSDIAAVGTIFKVFRYDTVFGQFSYQLIFQEWKKLNLNLFVFRQILPTIKELCFEGAFKTINTSFIMWVKVPWIFFFWKIYYIWMIEWKACLVITPLRYGQLKPNHYWTYKFFFEF